MQASWSPSSSVTCTVNIDLSDGAWWAEYGKKDSALHFLTSRNISCIFLFHSSLVLMEALVNFAVLLDLQLHSLFLSLPLQIMVLCQRAQPLSGTNGGPQIYTSEQASKLVAGESRTLSRNGQNRRVTAQKQTNLKTSLLCYVKESHSCLIQLQACSRIKAIRSLWVHQALPASSSVCPAPSTVLSARSELSVAGGSCPLQKCSRPAGHISVCIPVI